MLRAGLDEAFPVLGAGWTIPSDSLPVRPGSPGQGSRAGVRAGARQWVSLPEGQRSRSPPTVLSHTPSEHPLGLGTCWLTTPVCLSRLAYDCGPGGAWQLSPHDREVCVGEILVEIAWAAQASSTALPAHGSHGGEPCCAMAGSAIPTGRERRAWLLPGRLVAVRAGWDR